MPGLALEPAAVRLLDVVLARREDVEGEPAAGAEQLARLRRAPCARSSSLSRCRNDRNGQMTSSTRSSTGGSRRSPRRRSSGSRTPASSRPLARRRRACPRDESTPITSMPVGRDRDGDPAGAHAELDDGGRARARLLDVEADVLRPRCGSRGRRARRSRRTGSTRLAFGSLPDTLPSRTSPIGWNRREASGRPQAEGTRPKGPTVCGAWYSRARGREGA